MNLCAFPTLLALLTFTSVSCHAQKYDKKAVSYEAAQKEIYKTVNGKQLPLYFLSEKEKRHSCSSSRFFPWWWLDRWFP